MKRALAAGSLFFALIAPRGAVADAGGDVAQRVNAALQRAGSFSLALTRPNGAPAGRGTVVIAASPALSLALDVEGSAVRMTLLDGVVYQQVGNQLVSNPLPGDAAQAIPHLDAASVSALPNVREGGAELGAFRIDARAGSPRAETR